MNRIEDAAKNLTDANRSLHYFYNTERDIKQDLQHIQKQIKNYEE